MPGLPCDMPGCAFTSADGELVQKLQHLNLHVQTAHAGGGAAALRTTKIEPISRPTLGFNTGPEDYNYFLKRWGFIKLLLD